MKLVSAVSHAGGQVDSENCSPMIYATLRADFGSPRDG